MKSIFSFFVMIFSIYSHAFDLIGAWQSDTGGKLHIYPNKNGYIAYNKISYVDNNGKFTGKEIHYHWLFNPNDGSGELSGKLNSVDTHWNCELENGDFELTVLNNNRILIYYPQITFQINQKYSSKNERRKVPQYCHYHSRRESFDYICDWRWKEVKVLKNNLGSECKITSRNLVPIDLQRIN